MKNKVIRFILILTIMSFSMFGCGKTEVSTDTNTEKEDVVAEVPETAETDEIQKEAAEMTETYAEEDRRWSIDHWASLFKATTWEKLKMISKENESMQEAAQTLYTMHCDETIRDMARARQEQIAWETSMQRRTQLLHPN